jgi:hypothetical protein
MDSQMIIDRAIEELDRKMDYAGALRRVAL